MIRGLFHKPVVVQPGRIDRDRIVTGVTDAAKVLLYEWPAGDSKKRTVAMRACLDAINGEKSPGEARRAFVAAAKEARIYVGDIGKMHYAALSTEDHQASHPATVHDR